MNRLASAIAALQTLAEKAAADEPDDPIVNLIQLAGKEVREQFDRVDNRLSEQVYRS
jgi:hypothetical protein